MFALGTKTFFSYFNGENLIWKFFTLLLIRLLYLKHRKNLSLLSVNVRRYPYLIIGWEDEVLGPGGIWGRVQGVGSDHWGTRSLPSLGHHPRAARSRAKRAF